MEQWQWPPSKAQSGFESHHDLTVESSCLQDRAAQLKSEKLNFKITASGPTKSPKGNNFADIIWIKI